MQTSELLLPPGEDPDSLFRRIGKRAFRTIVAESQLTGHLQALKESSYSGDMHPPKTVISAHLFLCFARLL
jgi:DNA primase